MRCADTQVISTISANMNICMDGCISVMTRLVNSCVLFSLSLATSNRFSSSFSLPKARITESPVRISRETRFRPSTSFCMIRNFGSVTAKRTATNAMIIRIARAMIYPI